ncbi:MAG TPA: Fur family transcriptional regulator [Amaricoccus sp.]|nr:Fur family transcriptional regulator [Amaricoccus sp.]
MPASSAPVPKAFRPHDHGACRGRGLAAARELCTERRLRLTPARAFVLETLFGSHRAMTAYEILDALAAVGLGSQPPVVYRALDFLVANGLAHRIERLGAFTACSHAGMAHNAGFLICRACRRVAETPLGGPAEELLGEAAAAGFSIERTVVEAEGLCARCRGSGV